MTADERIFYANFPDPNTITAETEFVRNGIVYTMSWAGSHQETQKYWPELNAIASSLHVEK
jgi:hypothetical protein